MKKGTLKDYRILDLDYQLSPKLDLDKHKKIPPTPFNSSCLMDANDDQGDPLYNEIIRLLNEKSELTMKELEIEFYQLVSRPDVNELYTWVEPRVNEKAFKKFFSKFIAEGKRIEKRTIDFGIFDTKPHLKHLIVNSNTYNYYKDNLMVLQHRFGQNQMITGSLESFTNFLCAVTNIVGAKFYAEFKITRPNFNIIDLLAHKHYVKNLYEEFKLKNKKESKNPNLTQPISTVLEGSYEKKSIQQNLDLLKKFYERPNFELRLSTHKALIKMHFDQDDKASLFLNHLTRFFEEILNSNGDFFESDPSVEASESINLFLDKWANKILDVLQKEFQIIDKPNGGYSNDQMQVIAVIFSRLGIVPSEFHNPENKSFLHWIQSIYRKDRPNFGKNEENRDSTAISEHQILKHYFKS